MSRLLFSHIGVTNMKLINEKTYLIIAVSKWHGLPHSVTVFVFSLLCCKYICDIYLSVQDFNGLWKFSNIFLIGLPHAGLYNYNGRQINLFYVKWFVDRLTGPRFMSLWNAWGWYWCTNFLISLIIT